MLRNPQTLGNWKIQLEEISKKVEPEIKNKNEKEKENRKYKKI